ncbi:hypothetical protein BC832DRAFT_306852 [Gaertneriomyces semiglobifer]|nr:hypothetical protein BC832DRAFT_306852 [Gaertneriomyces semiglobifer]
MHTDYIHDGSISRAASVLVTSKRTPKPVARLINEIPGAPHMSRKKKRRKPHRRQQSDSAFSAVDKKKGVDGGNSCAVDATRYPQQHSGVTPETAKKPKRKRIKQPDEAAAEDARTSQGYEKVLKRLKHEMLSNTHGYAACPSTSTQYASIGSEADLVDSGGVEGPVAQPIDPVPEKPVSLVMRPCPFANVPDEQISLVSQDMLSPPPLGEFWCHNA